MSAARQRHATPPPLRGDEAWFFDIDGTLLDIAPSPEQVLADPRLADLLTAVAHRSDGAVALISGRSVTDIDRIFAGRAWPASGQHGAERRATTGPVDRAVDPALLREARTALQAAVAGHPDLRIEDKGMCLALHYRRRPALGSYAHQLMRRVGAPLSQSHVVRAGKRIVELVPRGKDKGTAIREFMQRPPFRGRVPVFVGDDVTDEDGFAAVNALHGISVKVGRGPTQARWRLRDVAAVRRWLATAGGRR